MTKTTAPPAEFDPTTIDGDRAAAMLGVRFDDPRLATLVRELGYKKAITSNEIELKKLGLVFVVDADVVSQVRFELRRSWTGCKKFPGRLPFGLSSDLKKTDADTTLHRLATLKAPLSSNDWCTWVVDGRELAMGFGKTMIEVLMVLPA